MADSAVAMEATAVVDSEVDMVDPSAVVSVVASEVAMVAPSAAVATAVATLRDGGKLRKYHSPAL